MADIFDFYVYDDRSIRFAIAEPIMLEDKDVTQFRFRIPKVLNNIDMTDWEWWFIFVNAKKVKYTTQLTLEDDEDDPDNFSVATYTVGYGFSGYVGSVSFSIEALNVSGEDIVNEWHTRTYNTHVIDTLQGTRAVVPEPGGQAGTGLTEEIRQALLQIARKVAYIDEHGQTYYNNLYDALYAIQAVTVSPTRVGLTTIGATSQLIGATVPSGGTITWTSSDTSVATVSSTGLVTSVGYGTATITATSGGKSATCSVLVAQAQLEDITAVYTQSGTVYDTDTLDSLKPDLVVTVFYDNQTSAVVTNYTLSGTLTVGTSTVTVNYAGLTTTFTVVVSENWKTLIGDDLSEWHYHTNASHSGNVITIAPSSVSWDNYVKPLALYQYSAIKNKRIRISGTVELTGYSSGKGFAIVPGTFTAPSESTRKAYLSLDNTQASTTGWITTNGTFTFDTESLTLADVLDTGTAPTDNDWVNAIIYLNANSGCVATITDVTMEYLD